MPITIIVEDGTGLETANSYVSLADANEFFDGHPQSAGWTGLASDDLRNRYLVTAARVIDSCFEFNGYKVNQSQALQWPRQGAEDRNSGNTAQRSSRTTLQDGYFPADVVPQGVKDAQCEMARFLIASNRMDDAPGTGIREFELTGSIRVAFEKGQLQNIVPDFVVNMLRNFGSFVSNKSGTVKLTRA